MVSLCKAWTFSMVLALSFINMEMWEPVSGLPTIKLNYDFINYIALSSFSEQSYVFQMDFYKLCHKVLHTYSELFYAIMGTPSIEYCNEFHIQSKDKGDIIFLKNPLSILRLVYP